ncbi:MAG: PKD domain-containing protein, partial [Saccharospirillaceae bacterium]|nr:PKD domain-containing protein [Pseudomonadales bacterium]NRB79925.1 PKD domain-containing protein [Saccharospirillaceae bacterium]
MKSLFLPIIAVSTLLSACSSSNKAETPETDTTTITGTLTHTGTITNTEAGTVTNTETNSDTATNSTTNTVITTITLTDTETNTTTETQVENTAPQASFIITTSSEFDVILDASASFDLESENNELSFVWFFSDGTQSSGEIINHTFSAYGNHTVQLTVIDASVLVSEIITQTYTIVEPAPIQADFSLLRQNTLVFLDASISTELMDGNYEYQWLIDDMEVEIGKNIDYDLNLPGEYKVTLILTDTQTQESSTKDYNLVIPEVVNGSEFDCSQAELLSCFDFESDIDVNDFITLPADENYQIDTTDGYKSNQSMKIKNVNQLGSSLFSIASDSNDFWARVFVKSSGDRNGVDFSGDQQGFSRNQAVILSASENDATVRISDSRCQLVINRSGGLGYYDDNLTLTSGMYGEDDQVCVDNNYGARMQPQKWYCLEVHFNGGESEVQVFWDNQNVEQLHVTANRTWTNADKAPGGPLSTTSEQPWGAYQFDTFSFGYQALDTQSQDTDFWFDNVATSLTRIGCSDEYVSHTPLSASTKLSEQDNGYPYGSIINHDSCTGNNCPEAGFAAWKALPASMRPSINEQLFAHEPMNKITTENLTDQIIQMSKDEFLETYLDDWKARELQVDDLSMPFYFKRYGDAEFGERSLFISMHGGGATSTSANDGQYENQKNLYNLTMNNLEGVYLAPRAPTDEWNMWFKPNMDEFFNI